VDGRCDDADGGAWTYKSGGGRCSYVETTPETNNAPKDPVAVAGLPGVFPEVTSVMDFGGGVGVYLTGFRNKGVTTLVTVEPHSLGDCLFAGIQQDTTDWINSPLSMLPLNKFDLVMSIEVVEHIPVQFHRHILQALEKATSKWLLLSAAHPGQPGKGHVGPSMKWIQQWIEEVHNWTSLRLDEPKTTQFHNSSKKLLQMNSAVFRKTYT
jgi:Methyltransferase domain